MTTKSQQAFEEFLKKEKRRLSRAGEYDYNPQSMESCWDAAVSWAREDSAKICKSKKLYLTDALDEKYNIACDDCEEAIRKADE